MKNSFKLLFFNTLILGTIISISSSSWFSIWMGLEINLLSFIPLSMKLNNSFSSEASLKYFLIQALASSMLLFSIIFFSIYEWSLFFLISYKKIINLILFSSLMLKTGMAPFHFWFPNVMEGLSWFMSFILMTWQKIAPLIIMTFTINYNFFIFIFFSTIIGSLGGLNQTSMRKLMAYSSINHLAWMLSAMMNNEIIWITYFFFYSFISFSLIFIFMKFSIFWMNQMFLNLNLKKNNKMMIFLPLFSLGGLPPFLGFFPKWLVIENLLMNNFFFILFPLIIFSLITLFFYIRMSFSILMMNFNKMNFKNFNFFLKFFNFSFFLKNNFLMMLLIYFSLFGLMIINFLIF